MFDFTDDEGDEDEDGEEEDDDDEGEGEHVACNVAFLLNTLLVLYKMSNLVLFSGEDDDDDDGDDDEGSSGDEDDEVVEGEGMLTSECTVLCSFSAH